jgi:hypothetical protein
MLRNAVGSRHFFEDLTFVASLPLFALIICAWRRGIVVVASASRTEDPWFDSRQDGKVFLVFMHSALSSKLYIFALH